ncbi:MAG: hypothetical protein PW735_01790 [Acidobacteriaceae bacterium]|nr:hypothetical protein [Acidobacteriaceae bacterium]
MIRSQTVLAALLVAAMAPAAAAAQSCTTQAKLPTNLRDTLAGSALTIATAIRNGDTATVQQQSASDLTENFSATAYVVRTLAEQLRSTTLHVTHLYELDANGRSSADQTPASFTCTLTGLSSETDFVISGLPPGLYAFAMVEAVPGGQSDRSYLLSLLLRQQGDRWLMAGVYPHPLSAAGHDGLWYWTDARSRAKAKQAWMAWLEYGVADALLRPANFVSTTHLDRLRNERADAAPAELRNGISGDSPLTLNAAGGKSYTLTGLDAVASDDGAQLFLQVSYKSSVSGNDAGNTAAMRAENIAVVKALMVAHPELKSNLFTAASVFAQGGSGPAFATQVLPSDW